MIPEPTESLRRFPDLRPEDGLPCQELVCPPAGRIWRHSLGSMEGVSLRHCDFELSPASRDPAYFAVFITQWRCLKWVLGGYLVALSFSISFLSLADIQYFEEAGKHLTSEISDYLSPSIWPDISGAFKLHPWLAWLSILACMVIAVFAALAFRWLWKSCFSTDGPRRAYSLLVLPICILLGCIGARGGLQPFILKVGDSLISPNPYLNALCLNPVYSTFMTTISSSPSRGWRRGQMAGQCLFAR